MKAAKEDQEVGALRRHNNRVKALLIDEWVSSDARVLDLCCGHGQDIQKYKRKNLKYYVGVDSAEQAVEEAHRRNRELNFKLATEGVNFFHGDVGASGTWERLRDEFGPKEPFDAASMQLAIHYFAESREKMATLLKRVWSVLKPRGKFLITTMSSKEIEKRLGPEGSFGNDIHSLNFGDSKPKMSMRNDWGIEYKFWLANSIDNQLEFIVPVVDFRKLIVESGFQLLSASNFTNYMDSKISNFRGLDDMSKNEKNKK